VRRARRALPAFARRRNVGVIADCAAETENLPVAGRRVPFQNSIGGKIFTQVQNVRSVGVLLTGVAGISSNNGVDEAMKKVRAIVANAFCFHFAAADARGIFNAIAATNVSR